MAETFLEATASASAKLEELRVSGRFEDSALRVRVNERGASFQYQLEVVKLEDRAEDDEVIEVGAVSLLVDPASVGRLRGATLEYVDDLDATGFRFENPNKPALLQNPIAGQVQQVLDREVNPGLANHGGNVVLMDVQGSRVVLEFSGGCQGCGAIDTTLRDGIEGILKSAVPEISEVIDSTDHSAGDNPYYSG